MRIQEYGIGSRAQDGTFTMIRTVGGRETALEVAINHALDAGVWHGVKWTPPNELPAYAVYSFRATLADGESFEDIYFWKIEDR
jgi:hypothetical protein